VRFDYHLIEYELGSIVNNSSHADNIKIKCNHCDKKALYLKSDTLQYNCFGCGRHGKLALDSPSTPTKKEIDQGLQIKILLYLIKNSELSQEHSLELLERRIFRPNRFLLRSIPFNVSKILSEKFSSRELRSAGLLNEGGNLISQFSYGNLLIPFISQGVIKGFQVKINKRDTSDKFKYLMFPGSKVGHHFYTTLPSAPNNYIIVTESPLKTISALDNGYNCAGFVGINPADKAILDLKQFLFRSKCNTYLIYDSSESDLVDSNLRSAQERFILNLGRKVQIKSLPLLKYSKMDLDKYLFIKGNLDDIIT